MKTLFKYLITVVGICILLTSCKKEEEPHYCPRDSSLAGTVSDGFVDYRGAVDCKYNGKTICDGTRNYIMDLTSVSYYEVDLVFKLEYLDTVVTVEIPKIPLSGVVSNASFDHTTAQGVVRVNDIKYYGATLLVRGWIRNTALDSRVLPYKPNYKCEINITGKLADKDFTLTMSGSTAIE